MSTRADYSKINQSTEERSRRHPTTSGNSNNNIHPSWVWSTLLAGLASTVGANFGFLHNHHNPTRYTSKIQLPFEFHLGAFGVGSLVYLVNRLIVAVICKIESGRPIRNNGVGVTVMKQMVKPEIFIATSFGASFTALKYAPPSMLVLMVPSLARQIQQRRGWANYLY